ncbi:MAG TPA: hypothetical protein VHV75_14760 [Solirubrobacteraceae bacterium]|nr:hypothetical protein [Solirubrobacteraceae bacterium]
MSDEELRDREAHVVRLLQAAAQTERAPAALRAEVDAMREQAGARRRLRMPALPRVALRYASLTTTALAAAAVALVLALSGGGGLSIAQAASFATRGPSAPAPAPDPRAPNALLTTRMGDLHFPNWGPQQGWRSTGQRSDRADGRAVKTVYYASGGRKLAYSIVSAPVLSGLDTHGEPYATMSQHGRTIVVWQERNHTCVLSANGMSGASLWKLASSTFS